MKNCKLKSGFLALAMGAAMTLSLTGCSDDDDSNGNSGDPAPNPPAQNQMNFTLSGDIEGEKTGQAFVMVVEAAGSGNVILSGNDGPGITEGQQTFSLNFYQAGTEIPEAGTYPISFDAGIDGSGFWVLYESFEDGFDNPVGYGGVNGASGTIEITSVTDDAMIGTFSFTATNADGTEIEAMEGSFNAGID